MNPEPSMASFTIFYGLEVEGLKGLGVEWFRGLRGGC